MTLNCIKLFPPLFIINLGIVNRGYLCPTCYVIALLAVVSRCLNDAVCRRPIANSKCIAHRVSRFWG